ncbi:MAG TPA: ABC transporter ATP-binding protein [Tissierellaceae bacterium]|nr:ABC transporter ATP-binding protein [Tissierellaceae bacterium]
MLLEINDLTKTYGNKNAVDNISFQVEENTLLCILGPSGCGKTTILNTIGGFVNPSSGSIILNNEDITSMAPEDRPISTVFQSYGLFPHKDVIENICYGLKFKGINKRKAKDQAMEILDLVGLRGHENKRINELSGGEQQRVALARSLIVKPKLLLLDEPFSNLDANLRVIMREEVKKLQNSFGITTIFVTHDQEDAFAVADKIILMNNGKIEQLADPYSLYNNPKDEFALNFIGNSSIIKRNNNIFYVRPEMVNLRSTGKTNGIINKKTFKGSTIEYEIVLDSEDVILSIDLNTQEDFEIGERVYADFKYKEINNK